MDEFIWTKFKGVWGQIKQLLNEKDASASDVFETAFNGNNPGYRMRKNSRIKLQICGPKEGRNKAYLDFSAFWDRNTNNCKHYRYVIWWSYDRELELNNREDHYETLMVGLKRSVRFDYHPEVDKCPQGHESYHWHPNGVSEVALPTIEMNPRKVILFAIYCFDQNRFNDLESNDQYKNDCEEIRKCFFNSSP